MRRFSVVIVVLALASIASGAADGQEREPDVGTPQISLGRGVFVGVERYDPAQLSNLEFAEDDAVALGSEFATLGYQTKVLAKSVSLDGRIPLVSAANILVEIEQAAAAAKPDQRFVVALFGHCVQSPPAKGSADAVTYFCPELSNVGKAETLLALDRVVAAIAKSPAVRKLLIVDGVRANNRPPRARVAYAAPTAIRSFCSPPPRGVTVLFSCAPGQSAREAPTLRHGLLAHALLQYLRGEAESYPGNEIGVVEAAAFARTKIADLARAARPPSPPQAPLLVAAATKPEEWSLGMSRLYVNAFGMRLRQIAAGQFLMGPIDQQYDWMRNQVTYGPNQFQASAIGQNIARANGWPEGHVPRSLNELPLHRVRITKPFWLGQYEVTQEQFEKIMAVNPSAFSAEGAEKERVKGLYTRRFPVESVSFADAQEFCRKLSRLDGRTYRLPTEAEWEYACRAATLSPFHFGTSANGLQFNCDGTKPCPEHRPPFSDGLLLLPKGPFLRRTTDVGRYPANAWGLHDMHGNVAEWCSDFYDAKYYEVSPMDDPQGPASAPGLKPERSPHVARGGHFSAPAGGCRSAARSSSVNASQLVGFRVVCEAVSEPVKP